MKIPSRPAPAVPTGTTVTATSDRREINGGGKQLKKKPPRPPPPKFKTNLNVTVSTSLIDLSSPPKENKFGIASWSGANGISVGNSSFYKDDIHLGNASSLKNLSELKKDMAGPTIIRAAPAKKKHLQVESAVKVFEESPPMPTMPPPSPPKGIDSDSSISTPYGFALYNYPATHKDDLPLQVNDVVILVHKINNEWLYGRVGDDEGMFPVSFVDIQVPLLNNPDNEATVLYEFNPETLDDLKLSPGDKVRVLKRISNDWLYGICNEHLGQFPANFIDRIPPCV